MSTVNVKLHPSNALLNAPKPVRDKYTQGWLNTFALKAPSVIAQHIAETHPFTSRTGWAATKWKGEVVGNNKIRISSLVAYTYWLNRGVRPHQMTYLLNAKGAIPIQTAGGLIFRRPSIQSMQMGKWRHPGRPGTFFFEKSIEKLVAFMRDHYKDIIVENLEINNAE